MPKASPPDDDHSVCTTAQQRVLASLPAALAAASDREVLRVAARSISQLFEGLGYVRLLLVSQNYTPSELLELCVDAQMAAAIAAAADGGGGDGVASSSSGAPATAQQAAMRRGMALHTPHLQQQQQHNNNNANNSNGCDFADWQLLHRAFGMQSFAAVPLIVAGTVHGVIVAASPTPHTFTPSSMPLLQSAGHMLAPYAAIFYKHQQITAARGLLEQVLPPRVVAAAIDRLSQGGTSAVDVFVPSHHDAGGGAV